MNEETSMEFEAISKADPLFADRFEDRFILHSDKVNDLIDKMDLPEDETQSQWVTTLYLNTDEHTLLTGTAVRFREYSKNREDVTLEDRKGFVDYNSLLYNKKQKERKEAYLSEIINELNDTYPSRYSDFRVVFAISYKRRVYRSDKIRVTIDYPVQCYRVSHEQVLTDIQAVDYVHVEVKSHTLDSSQIALVQTLGGTCTIPKYYSLYNLEYSENAEKKYPAYFDDSCGYEYEKKLTLDSEEVFNEFVVKILNNEVEGYKGVEDLPNPFCFTSFNEYRRFKEDGSHACIMYTGDEIQRISKKDKGQILKNNILKRRKTELILPEHNWKEMMDDEIVGVSLRIKKYFLLRAVKPVLSME